MFHFFSLHADTSCFEEGTYGGTQIDYLENVSKAANCQLECQKHTECQFWTYEFAKKRCWRQRANASEYAYENAGAIRGPRAC